MNKPILEKNRLEAFSDGVIAIIITLLVLEIKVPHIEGSLDSQAVLSSLKELSPKLISWAVSFFMILIMWVNHHRIFNYIKHSDNGLMWWNGLLLFFISFVPFPTAFMGDYFYQPVSIFFFGICLMFVGLAFFFLRRHLYYNPGLMKDNLDKIVMKRLLLRSLISPVLYLIGALLSFVNIYLSFIIFIGIPVYFVFYRDKKD